MYIEIETWGREKMYLFHATVDSNKENILRNGLRVANKNSIMYDGSKTKGKIFLANDYDIAYSFVESSDTDDEKIIEQIENDKIVVFKIDISKLNQSHLHNDKNIILEEGEKPYSFEYTENISPDYLQICEKED